MGFTANVNPGDVVASPWGNEIRDRSCQVFANTAERDAQWPNPPVGALSALASTPGVVYQRNATAWAPLNWLRYGAQAQASNTVANGAVVTPANWGGPIVYGGATVSTTAGIQLPTAPGLVAITLYLTTSVAPAATTYVRATVVQTPGGFIQTQAFLGQSQTIGTAMTVFALDAAGYSYNCQITHNLGASSNILTQLSVFKVGP